MQPGTPISASDVTQLIESCGTDKVVTVDIHAGQIAGFFGPKTNCDSVDS